MAVKHSFTCAIADDPASAAAGEILPSHFNAGHVIDDNTFVAAKLSMAAANKVVGSIGSTGAAVEIDCTAAGRALLDDADAAAQRTTLGLGTAATTAATDYATAAQGTDSRAPNGSAGGDLGGTYPNPTVTQARGIRETTGPTTLVVGAVADGEYLKRVGSTVVGGTPAGGGGTSTLVDGLSPTWVSATVLGASAGSCYIESLGTTLYGAPSNITPSSPTANTWYHVYGYSNAGTLTLEASTTAPVAFATPLGTARSKSGDTSRRYLYSARTNGSSQFRRFLFDPSINAFYWANTQLNAAPFRVLSNGSSTSSTAIDCSAVVPVTSRGVTGFYQNYHATAAMFVSPFDFAAAETAFSLGVAAVSFVYATVPCSSDQKLNYIVTAGGSGMYIDVYGFPLQR